MIRPETVGTPARRFSDAERDEIRRRLAAGERHKDIAAAVGASTKAVQRLIYADRKPPPAWLFSSESRLTFADREEISRRNVSMGVCRSWGGLNRSSQRLEHKPGRVSASRGSCGVVG